MSTAPGSGIRWLRAWKSPLLSILCAVGVWTYLERVLIPFQISEAAAHDRPRGNLSDLYPRWLGAQELLLHGRDPYSEEVTREIQAGYYGRPLDSTRSGDPRDKAGFAYPVYVVFFLAPTVKLPFAIVQRSFFWLLVFLTASSTLLWFRVARWPASFATQCSALALTLGSIAVMQGLKLQQISLLIAALICAAIILLEADHAVAAGVLLAVATVKPQLVILLVIWLAIWTFGDWRRRYRLAVSFGLSMAILLAASEWLLPHWIPRFWHALGEYRDYAPSTSVMDGLIGTPWSRALELLAVAGLLGACWKERRQAANSGSFAFMASMALAITILVLPMPAQYNQVLLIPALLFLTKERRSIWQRNIANRILLVTVSGLLLWSWVASEVLAGLSFVVPERAERAWAAPIWTTPQIPVAVAALMLVYYYQRSFAAPSGPGSS
jgi:hypothetical protein